MKKSFLICLLLLPGCLPKPIPPRAGDPAWGVDITWHGHSCFSLQDSVGRTIVIDPYDNTVGFGFLRLRADALLITHAHFDHNEKRAVKARSREIDLMESTGTKSVAMDLSVTGIDSFHDKFQGQVHGPNKIFSFSMGGLRIVHLGDLGQETLTELQKAAIGAVDVLMIPIGGFTTLDGPQAKKIMESLKPKAVFPMHYGHTRFYPLAPLDSFTSLFPKEQIKTVGLGTLRLRPSELTEKPLIFILTPLEKNY